MQKIIQYSVFIILTGCICFIACKKVDRVAPFINTPPPPPPPNPPAITDVQLIAFGNLSKPRYNLLAATAGNKILFVGGRYFVSSVYYDSTDNTWSDAEYISSRVDIYDTSTHTWSIAELDGSNYEDWCGVATVGSKIFFTGGYGYSSPDSSRIDIYDANLNSWSFIKLPSIRRDIAVAAGTKVFFAGGGGDGIDIYDVSNNAWSGATLSVPRGLISGVFFANKIFFAGGLPLSTRVDIYNVATQSWSTAELSTSKYLVRTAKAGNKLLFDGGDDFSNGNSVDIYDDSTQSWSSVTFPWPTRFWPTASLGDNAFSFMYVSQANIYNSVNNIWSIATMTPRDPYGHKAAITVGDQIYLAGGFDGQTNTGKVWKIKF